MAAETVSRVTALQEFMQQAVEKAQQEQSAGTEVIELELSFEEIKARCEVLFREHERLFVELADR